MADAGTSSGFDFAPVHVPGDPLPPLQLEAQLEDAAMDDSSGRLDELLRAARGEVQLGSFDHSDADLLLRGRQDPRVSAAVSTLSSLKLPPEGGLFFWSKGGAHAHPGMVKEPQPDWVTFQENGAPSLNPKVKGRGVNKDGFWCSPSNVHEGILRKSCSQPSSAKKAKRERSESPPQQHTRFSTVGSYYLVRLAGHAAFPASLVRERNALPTRDIKEAKDQIAGDYMIVGDVPCVVYAAASRVAADDDYWNVINKLRVQEAFELQGRNVYEWLEDLQRRVEASSDPFDVVSPNADLAEWFPLRDPNENVGPGDVVFCTDGLISKQCPAVSFGSIVFVVSTAPAFLGNQPKDEEEQARGRCMMLLGQGPVRVEGKASAVPRSSILVPSGKNDGRARAVTADEVAANPRLLTFAIGTVLRVPSAAEDTSTEAGEGFVHAFVSSKPEFGSCPNLVDNMKILEARASAPRMELRCYQVECIEKAKTENVVINLATGMGKTLIAIRVIEHFLNLQRSREDTVALFIVPTRPLVKQQAANCRVQCLSRIPRVTECAGSAVDQWTRQHWTQLVSSSDILVGTPEVFRRAFVDFGFLGIGQVSIMVFDEAHYATGNSPYAAIMNDAFHPAAREGLPCPRVVGLTASFVGGKLKGIEKKRQDLETLLQSSLFSPDISKEPVQDKEMTQLKYAPDALPGMMELARAKTMALLQEFTTSGDIQVMEQEKVISRVQHVFEQLGMTAFIYYLREGVVKQLAAHSLQLAEMATDAAAQRKRRLLAERLPRLQRQMREAADALHADGELTKAPNVSSKYLILLQLIQKLLHEHADDPNYKGIIFVEQIALTFPLMDLLNRSLGPAIGVGCVSGGSSMTEPTRTKTLDKFRRSELRVLVCTNALEEGIDVPECAFVIRFTQIKTTKSHIQGAGRGRRKDAQIFYFDNDPEVEQESAALLEEVARDRSLAMSEEKRLASIRDDVRAVEGFYPFGADGPDGSGEVNLFNCEGIFTNYCSKVLGQTLNIQESLMRIDTQMTRSYPPEERTFLAEVRYPSPDGMKAVLLEEVNAVWGDVRLDSVLDPARSRNWSSADQERGRFLFATVVQMRRLGYLTASNQPSSRALTATKAAVDPVVAQSRVRVRNAFSQSSLPTSQAASSSSAPPPPSEDDATNYKGKLNEQKHVVVSYASVQVVGTPSHAPRFVTTVTLTRPHGSNVLQGDERATRKQAEQAAARAAWFFLDLD